MTWRYFHEGYGFAPTGYIQSYGVREIVDSLLINIRGGHLNVVADDIQNLMMNNE